jgi:hypothetical protein
MATTKKKSSAPKKRRKPLGARTTKRRKKTRSGKNFLGEMFKPEAFKEAGKNGFNGLLGGGLGKIVDSLLPADTNDFMRFLIHGGGIVVMGASFKMPKMATGWAGGLGWDTMGKLQTKLLSEMENADFANKDSMEETPDALDENGTPMYLAEDGNFYYMEEFELGEDGEMYLSASFQANDMYPQYINSSRY